jgi:hypothetical protein
MGAFWLFLQRLDWGVISGVSGVIIAVISLFVARKTLHVADKSLAVARRAQEDANEDWAQRKWFDLYVAADHAFNLLDRFRQVHPNISMNPAKKNEDWNDVMLAIRHAHSMALVFPQNAAMDKFFAATSVFNKAENAYNTTYVDAVLDATEDLRDMAKLKPEVLNRRKLPT